MMLNLLVTSRPGSLTSVLPPISEVSGNYRDSSSSFQVVKTAGQTIETLDKLSRHLVELLRLPVKLSSLLGFRDGLSSYQDYLELLR
ncbi:hypothetical protein QYF36_017192 [Acer negundo]|nr:hypothetical protein QYF36_017192 [Acer negundo]